MSDGQTVRASTIARIQTKMVKAGIREEDLRESFITGSGSGGQKINKTSSCVALLHVPTGVSTRCQRTRSREDNRWLARDRLAEKLLEKMKSRESAKIQEIEKERRRKRRKSRRQRAITLAGKRLHSAKKAARKPVSPDE
ncbi:MAG: peptide chain release factor family protein [Kiritimatiellia bacterium]|jgi:protein subunit release factor B